MKNTRHNAFKAKDPAFTGKKKQYTVYWHNVRKRMTRRRLSAKQEQYTMKKEHTRSNKKKKLENKREVLSLAQMLLHDCSK